MKTPRAPFLHAGNWARSILCVATLNHLGGNQFIGYRADSQPADFFNPYALRQLTRQGISAA